MCEEWWRRKWIHFYRNFRPINSIPWNGPDVLIRITSCCMRTRATIGSFLVRTNRADYRWTTWNDEEFNRMAHRASNPLVSLTFLNDPKLFPRYQPLFFVTTTKSIDSVPRHVHSSHVPECTQDIDGLSRSELEMVPNVSKSSWTSAWTQWTTAGKSWICISGRMVLWTQSSAFGIMAARLFFTSVVSCQSRSSTYGFWIGLGSILLLGIWDESRFLVFGGSRIIREQKRFLWRVDCLCF